MHCWIGSCDVRRLHVGLLPVVAEVLGWLIEALVVRRSNRLAELLIQLNDAFEHVDLRGR